MKRGVRLQPCREPIPRFSGPRSGIAVPTSEPIPLQSRSRPAPRIGHKPRGSTIVTLLCLWLFAIPATGQITTEPERQALFVEANQLFREANEVAATNPIAADDLYRRSALRFERLVTEGGVRNGKLFYNIGNAYFRTNDVGRAILNYRRAGQYMGDDPNLAQNLNHARGTRLDSFEETQETQVLKTLLFWHYDISTGWRSILFALLAAVFWTAAGVRLFRSEWAPRLLLIATGLPAVLFLGSLVVEASVKADQAAGVILSQQVIARKGDGESYEPSFKEPLHAGAEFLLVEERRGWFHVELPDERRCWIPAASSELVSLPGG